MIRDDEEEEELKKKREIIEQIVLDYQREYLSIHTELDSENYQKEFDEFDEFTNFIKSIK